MILFFFFFLWQKWLNTSCESSAIDDSDGLFFCASWGSNEIWECRLLAYDNLCVFCCLPIIFANSLESEHLRCQAWSQLKLFDNLMVILKVFVKNKNNQHSNYPACKELEQNEIAFSDEIALSRVYLIDKLQDRLEDVCQMYFSIQPLVLGTQKHRLSEVVLLSTTTYITHIWAIRKLLIFNAHNFRLFRAMMINDYLKLHSL